MLGRRVGVFVMAQADMEKGFAVAADNGELLAVIRVVEIADEFRLEVSQLLSERAIKVLEPDIIGLALANLVNDASPIAFE